MIKELLKIKLDHIHVEGELIIPDHCQGIVIFSHGSGSGRFSPRNNFVAQYLKKLNLGTFLFDLLTREEAMDSTLRFNIPLLTERLEKVSRHLLKIPYTKSLPFCYFGGSTGAASAMIASTLIPRHIAAIVSRGGRLDLSYEYLPEVEAPSLLIVGEYDNDILEINRRALDLLQVPKKLEIVPGATHLFEEPGCLEQVAELAGNWFLKYARLKSNQKKQRIKTTN
ncbi:dienelactone hydrolase family protein [Cecembia calidifontis]|jgi:pimeloyl-ACP methyl ester carboxylesterase|uniref:Dienelactone hydrolase n=1 Tax=Cecembia calidifontis TaxID=1187080 RepID=A0A4Q7PBG6_9BACT|nr:alpha/beta hydrolase [Cecembia calidifontis]RZS97643.1 hypothetical protein BC751_3259 [Cecembia calidifontis]